MDINIALWNLMAPIYLFMIFISLPVFIGSLISLVIAKKVTYESEGNAATIDRSTFLIKLSSTVAVGFLALYIITFFVLN